MGVVLMGEVERKRRAGGQPRVPRARHRTRRSRRISRSTIARGDALAADGRAHRPLPTSPLALQDALATGKADAVLVIPAGFGDAPHGCRSNGEARTCPQLEARRTADDMQAAALASQRASRWASLVAAQAALEPALDADSIVDAVTQTQQRRAIRADTRNNPWQHRGIATCVLPNL